MSVTPALLVLHVSIRIASIIDRDESALRFSDDYHEKCDRKVTLYRPDGPYNWVDQTIGYLGVSYRKHTAAVRPNLPTL